MTSVEKNEPTDASRMLIAKIHSINQIYELLQSASHLEEKILALQSLDNVKKYLEIEPLPLSHRSQEDQYLILALIALDQGPILFSGWQDVPNQKEALERLIKLIQQTERFYDYMGGIVGYFLKTVELIAQKVESEQASISVPPKVSIQQENEKVCHAIVEGIKTLETMAEVYVVGGSGDRLDLKDDASGMPLPVACLQFAGKSLLEGLVRDIQAREYLYYKLTGKQVTVPLMFMTSEEKANDTHVQNLLEKAHYFGRKKESIVTIVQPLAPVLTIEGNLAVKAPLELIVKPGGHGVIWKLARDAKALDWLLKLGKTFCLVRQINNPLAGIDYGLLALAGYGTSNKMAFGFLSCPSQKGMTEGVNVLRTTKSTSTISNLEYTGFAKLKAHDPLAYPANTNILFADIRAVIDASQKLPMPGLIVNLKHKVKTRFSEIYAARLESSMQNIADAFTDPKVLRTFVLLNDRKKTMSVTKKSFDKTSIQETPESCFYDLLKENLSLLKERCFFTVPESQSVEDYIANGPNAIFLYHPALGPLYDIIAQKISKGRLSDRAELQIEAEEVLMHHLELDGSLLITAKNQVGSLELKNVRIVNKGIDQSAKNSYWKNDIKRKECCEIILEGNSSFVARNVTLTGNHRFIVQDGEEVTISQDNVGKLVIERKQLTTWPHWHYEIDSDNKIILSRREKAQSHFVP